MDWWVYYRSLLHHAASEALDVIGWRTTPFVVIICGFVVWALTMAIFSRIEAESNVFAQVRWYIAGGLATAYVGLSLFALFVVLAPYRLANEAKSKLASVQADAAKKIKAAQSDAETQIGMLRSERDALVRKLDDRIKQQEKAEEYSHRLDHGRSYANEWMKGIREKNTQLVLEKSAQADKWLGDVKDRLRADFGNSVAQRFNLAKATGPIGFSAKDEHDARLVILDKLIQEMRSGSLPLLIKRVPPA